jgi:FkbM family methyltransferase
MNSDRPTPLNIESLCQRYKVVPKGIIHIGAHEGQELAKYLQMGATEVLLIEANPEICQKLQTKIADIPNVSALNYAICDREGKINLRLNSYDYSSSILPLKQHQDIYPNMLEVGEIEVEARTLDQVLKEQRINNPDSNNELDRQFNILAIDIQGAELLALEGAKETLRTIDAIYTEVNLQELYEGCALLEQIDQFLAGHHFQRVAIKTPFHPFYGDALYLKTDILAKSQITIVTSIAPQNYENQKLAIDSWRSHGFQPVSLNCAEEVIELQSLYPEVIFHAVDRHAGAEVGKPLIYLDHIFDYLQNHLSSGNGIFAIVNADIQLKLDFDTQLLIENEAKQSLVVSSRVEIKEPLATSGQIYTRGFDAFFFDAELLAKIPKSNYCLGMPWWDFWLPLMAQQNQIEVKYLAEPIAYHVQHKINYSSQLWEKYGIQFTQLFEPELGAKFEYIQKNNLPDLRPQLIGVIDTFLQSFHHHSQRLHNMSGQILTQAINSEAAQLHLETGNIYREQGKSVEAIASYQKSLHHDPNYAPAYLGLAKIYLATAKLELATESISHIQALHLRFANF